ncbi:MAG: (d)CMP kinase, partial [Victivallaceae bacterium]|nr:(d)CMP kinase [Victivallaceae bacterium]
SAIPLVRQFLRPVQRSAAVSGWIVMEGRDIGTVVFPDARCKFFLTASLEARARRRLAQTAENATGATFASVCADLVARDKRDAGREIAPLKKADDAISVDTSDMTIDEVVDHVIWKLPAELRPAFRI